MLILIVKKTSPSLFISESMSNNDLTSFNDSPENFNRVHLHDILATNEIRAKLSLPKNFFILNNCCNYVVFL